MSEKGQDLTRVHPTTLIRKREEALYGHLIEAETALKEHISTVIKTICSEMIYDFRDKYLKITFTVFFPLTNTTVEAKVQHNYYTAACADSESAKTSHVTVSDFKVTKEVMDYFVSRTLNAPGNVYEDFVMKKLEAYESDYDVYDNEDATLYSFSVTYLLGARHAKKK